MEFKGDDHFPIHSSYERVLIESDWNLKKIMFSISQVSVAVLIESDWNLKLNPSTIEKLPTVVLIESDWNLKEIIQR